MNSRARIQIRSLTFILLKKKIFSVICNSVTSNNNITIHTCSSQKIFQILFFFWAGGGVNNLPYNNYIY